MNGNYNSEGGVPTILMEKCRAEREAAGLSVDEPWQQRTRNQEKRFRERVKKERLIQQRWIKCAPDGNDDPYLPDRSRVEWWMGQLRTGQLNTNLLRPDSEISWLFQELLAYACIVGDRHAIRLLVQWQTSERNLSRLKLVQLLRHLEAAAFWAYLRKKVTPKRDSFDIPRPVYVKPRPPTAPIAPPST